MRIMTVREAVRLLEYDDETATVLVLKTEGAKEAEITWSIPIDAIPKDFRALRSEFELTVKTSVPEGAAEMDQVGKHPPSYSVAAMPAPG